MGARKKKTRFNGDAGTKLFTCHECRKTKPRAEFAKSQFKKKSKLLRCIVCTCQEEGSSPPRSPPSSKSRSTKATDTCPKQCDKETFMAVFADLLKELEYALLQIVQAAQMTQQM